MKAILALVLFLLPQMSFAAENSVLSTVRARLMAGADGETALVLDVEIENAAAEPLIFRAADVWAGSGVITLSIFRPAGLGDLVRREIVGDPSILVVQMRPGEKKVFSYELSRHFDCRNLRTGQILVASCYFELEATLGQQKRTVSVGGQTTITWQVVPREPNR